LITEYLLDLHFTLLHFYFLKTVEKSSSNIDILFPIFLIENTLEIAFYLK
jgi:hypothetical protein